MNKNSPLSIGILGSTNGFNVGRLCRALFEMGVTPAAMILDDLELSKLNVQLHEERTAGRLPPIPLDEPDISSIPIHVVTNHNSIECVDLIKTLQINLLINAETPRILKRPILEAPKFGVLNCHPGLLPHFRGCTCVEWAIYLDKQVGNTVHLMSEGIDEGPILATEALTFKKTDRYVDVRVKTQLASFNLIAKTSKSVLDGEIDITSLPAQEKGTYYKPIPPDKMKTVNDKLISGEYHFQFD